MESSAELEIITSPNFGHPRDYWFFAEAIAIVWYVGST